jgi:hypothetical protein
MAVPGVQAEDDNRAYANAADRYGRDTSMSRPLTPAGRASAKPRVAFQPLHLLFEPEFFQFKAGERAGIGLRTLVFLENPTLKAGMAGFQGLDAGLQAHVASCSALPYSRTIPAESGKDPNAAGAIPPGERNAKDMAFATRNTKAACYGFVTLQIGVPAC